LAHRWHLPDDLVCCILFQHQGLKILAHPQLGRSSAAAVALSALLPDQLRQSENGIGQLVKLEEKWKVFDIRKLAETVDQQQEEMGFGIKNDFPLSRRCEAFLNKEAPTNEGMLTAASSS